jgi:hypothetical protein
LENNISMGSFNRQIDYHEVIENGTANPILMFISDFIVKLLIDAKEFLQPNRGFYGRILIAHKHIYKALLEKDSKKIREEMINHNRGKKRDLIVSQRIGSVQNFNLRRSPKRIVGSAIHKDRKFKINDVVCLYKCFVRSCCTESFEFTRICKSSKFEKNKEGGHSNGNLRRAD